MKNAENLTENSIKLKFIKKTMWKDLGISVSAKTLVDPGLLKALVILLSITV